MSGRLKNIVVVSGATLGSRILGLLRDIVMFTFLGASAVSSAFIFAFTLPNLFRRLLGEGVLSSALIPVLSGIHEKRGREEAFRFFNQVFTWTVLVLVVLVGAGIGLLSLFKHWGGLPERWYVGFELAVILLPYMILVCLAAVLAAVLNVLNRFGVSSLSQVWLNISMIVSLFVGGYLFHEEPLNQVYCLCVGVVVGGVFQVVIPLVALIPLGWRPGIDFRISQPLRELLTLFIPGLLGAAVFQINIMVSRLLAFSLNDSAASTLYLANRFIEFPLGIFTIAITTVLFPSIAKIVANGDQEGLAEIYSKGLRMIMLITIPAMFGLLALAEPILRVLFEWGHFDNEAIHLTKPILMIYALGLPFYSLVTFATRGFHAQKDMKTPFKVAIIAFFMNFLLSLFFMRLWGMEGLAVANIIAMVVQAVLLQGLLSSKNEAFQIAVLTRPLLQIITGSSLMGLFALFFWQTFAALLGFQKLTYLLTVIVGVPFSITLYFSILWIFKFENFRSYVKLH